jgi:hypothetical protein
MLRNGILVCRGEAGVLRMVRTRGLGDLRIVPAGSGSFREANREPIFSFPTRFPAFSPANQERVGAVPEGREKPGNVGAGTAQEKGRVPAKSGDCGSDLFPSVPAFSLFFLYFPGFPR